MKDTFFKIEIRNVRPEHEDELSGLCFELGAEGISEVLPFRQNLEDYSVQTLPQTTKTLEVFFISEPPSEFTATVLKQFAEVQINTSQEANRDWMAEWKKGFVPFELVSQVFVVPHWCEPPAEAKHIIWLEPGMAFGTGTHETTRLAAQLLAAELAKRPGARVIDVGTGTGILAILAKLLGAGEVIATDIDPEAVRVAQENFELNKVSDIAVSTQDLSEFAVPFDIVVANIIDGVLTTMQAGLKRLTAPGGALIMSGIIDERLETFLNRFRMPPLLETKRQQLNEWHGFTLTRPQA